MTYSHPLDDLLLTLPRKTTTEIGDAFELVSDLAMLGSHEFGDSIARILPWKQWAYSVGLNEQDTGIDRIAVLKDGGIIAIQNKGFVEGATVGLDAYSKLKATSELILGRPVRMLMITSGRALARNAQNLNSDTGHEVTTLPRVWLRDALTTVPADYRALQKLHNQTLSGLYRKGGDSGAVDYRPDQTDACTNIITALELHSAVQFISACGTGKTCTAFLIASKLNAKVVIFLAPTLILLKQSVRAWQEQAGAGNLNIIAVCSDNTVGGKKPKPGETGYDAWVVNPEDFTCEVTQTAEGVAEFLTDKAGSEKMTVVFTTYASVRRVVAAQHELGAPTFDFAFADEAHHLAGTTKSDDGGELVKEKDDALNRLRAVKRVYATATPRLISQRLEDSLRKAGNLPDTMLETGSTVFGPRAFHMSFGAAIGLGILCHYGVDIVATNSSAVVGAVDNNENVRLETGDIVTMQVFATIEAIRLAYKKGARRFVVYHNLIEKSVAFTDVINKLATLPGSGLPPAAHVDGTQSENKRDLTLKRLANQSGGLIVNNARCLLEGVDIPNLDAVVFADPKQSVTDIAQAVGRALRTHHEKERALIVIPIVVPFGDTERAELTVYERDDAVKQNPTYATMFSVFEALEDHDEAIRHFMTDARFAGAIRGPGGNGSSSVADSGPVTTDDGTDYTTIFRSKTTTGDEPEITFHAAGVSAEQRDAFAQSIRLVSAHSSGGRRTESEQIAERFAGNKFADGLFDTIEEAISFVDSLSDDDE